MADGERPEPNPSESSPSDGEDGTGQDDAGAVGEVGEVDTLERLLYRVFDGAVQESAKQEITNDDWQNWSLGGYRLMSRARRGGQAFVFKGTQDGLSREVAIKIVRNHANNPTATDQLIAEAKRTAECKHKNVVQVIDALRDEQRRAVWMVMEWLDGETLAERLDRDAQAQPRRCMSWQDAFHIGVEVLEALAVIHGRKESHCDVKPSNIFLCQGKEPQPVKLIDLGLGAMHDPVFGNPAGGVNRGTPHYAAPEQFEGTIADHRVDIYSLGATLYHALTGERPFPKATDADEHLAARRGDVPDPCAANKTLPAFCSDVIRKAMAKNPDDRFQDASEFRDAIRRTLEADRASAARSPQAGPRWYWLVVFVVVVGATGFVARNLFERDPRKDEPPDLYAGDLNLAIKQDGNEFLQNVPLHEFGEPLRPGHRIRVVGQVNNPAYLYLFWVDARGEAAPIYPWVNGDWGKRRGEQKRTRLPPLSKEVFSDPLAKGASGPEYLALLVRAQPLPPEAEAEVKAAFQNLPRQEAFLQQPLWFENGELTPSGFDDQGKPLKRTLPRWKDEDGQKPIFEAQRLLRRRLDRLFPYIRVVCFDFSSE